MSGGYNPWGSTDKEEIKIKEEHKQFGGGNYMYNSGIAAGVGGFLGAVAGNGFTGNGFGWGGRGGYGGYGGCGCGNNISAGVGLDVGLDIAELFQNQTQTIVTHEDWLATNNAIGEVGEKVVNGNFAILNGLGEVCEKVGAVGAGINANIGASKDLMVNLAFQTQAQSAAQFNALSREIVCGTQKVLDKLCASENAALLAENTSLKNGIQINSALERQENEDKLDKILCMFKKCCEGCD